MVENLKKLRTESGMSQQKLAELIGTSQQSVNKYENSAVEPDISTLIAMADVFDVSVDYLIGRASPAPREHNNINFRRLTTDERIIAEAMIAAYLRTKSILRN